MSRKSRIARGFLVAAVIGAGAALLFTIPRPRIPSVVGVVLTQDLDPRKQAPIPNVQIEADDGTTAEAKSNSSGFFRLNLRSGISRAASMNLKFRHPDYQPLDIRGRFADKLCVIRMVPRPSGQRAASTGPEVLLSNIRVRYTMRGLKSVNIGSMVKTFEVPNKGNVPCDRSPCSPDGEWKAAVVTESFDAGEGHEFQNARVSCIAGPCPFTKIESDTLSAGGRVVKVSILNWSDTVTFLFEAEVIHTMPSDLIRQLYPAIFGRNLNFTLPAAAEGPSIEAEMDGGDIVFPLGRNLSLSWAVCVLQIASDKTKLYSCELKPGYRFR